MSEERPEGDLQMRVNELEAVVDGLTDELVEAKDRIRSLESHLGIEEEPDSAEATAETAEGLFESAADGNGEGSDGEDADVIDDDIIVG
ncbi:MAG: bZIP transcription factor [Halodesulfurarchaeum sp.]